MFNLHGGAVIFYENVFTLVTGIIYYKGKKIKNLVFKM